MPGDVSRNLPAAELDDDEREAIRAAGRCADPDCDGEAGHDGPHFQWMPE